MKENQKGYNDKPKNIDSRSKNTTCSLPNDGNEGEIIQGDEILRRIDKRKPKN